MDFFLSMIAAVIVFVGLPVVTMWGWLRWLRNRDLRHFFPAVSFAAFACASLAGLLAIFSVLYIQAAQLSPYDYRWYRLFIAGLFISALSLLLSVIGIWQRSVLRWHAPFCASGILFVWFVLAAVD